MLLTIDVGNTHTVLGLFDGDDIVEHWRISTDARRTADELAVLLQGLMGMHPLLGEELGDGIDGIAICATVPSVLHELREVTRRYYGDVPAVLVEPGVKTGVPILTDNPKEVGADRIINAVAAVELYGGPAIVVDFGTATTFDAVSARGEYVGGVIAPGIEISVDALGVKGAQLRKIEVARPRSVIGKNALDSEMIWQAAFMDGFYSPGKERLHAIGAIDLALWDIKGKALNAPLYQLFGGKAREHIELYATSGLPQGIVPPAEAAAMGLKERAAATMAAGYRVYRVDGGILPSTGRAVQVKAIGLTPAPLRSGQPAQKCVEPSARVCTSAGVRARL